MTPSVRYLSALDAAPAGLDDLLDELAERLQAGDPQTVDVFLAAHPEHATELRRRLPAMQVLAGLDVRASVDRSPELTERDLGDYRILREVGRGGMGVVYEAEQLSLSRRVALKVLPFAATMDATQLQRFKNEAKAAASLKHDHIVPIYAVGCERGVHFYAMEFVDGQTLAQWITEKRGPREPSGTVRARGRSDEVPLASRDLPDTAPVAALSTKKDKAHFRHIAELVAQAADALEHAHSMGIVHRDVKPGNLLLDSAGKVYVSDFGLARFGPDAGMTVTGDMIGTLRYMSPEQALAKHGLVDHRTDVYSLGATLYELLTLRPAVDGADKQEILKRIAFEEPTPLRRIDKSIPAELETITLKALAKEPGERYGSAGELAEDLRRWLGDRAIKAKPPGWWERAAKWGRRHRPLAAASLTLVLATLALTGLWLLHQSGLRAATALAVAEDLQAADLWQKQENWPEALQALERASGRLAASNVTALRELVDGKRKEIALVAWLDDARLQEDAISNQGLGFDHSGADRAYRTAFLEHGLDLSAMSPEEAAARIRASAIRGRLIAALDDWARNADDLVDGSAEPLRAVARLADDDPWRQRLRDPKVRKDRAALERLAEDDAVLAQPPETLVQLGIALGRANGRDAAARLSRRAQQTYPADFKINSLLAEFLDKHPAAIAEAVGYYRAAVAIRPNCAMAHSNLGVALHKQGKTAEAIEAHRRAIQLAPGYAYAHNNLGTALNAQQKYAEALAAFQEANKLKPDSGLVCSNMGRVLWKLGRAKEAEASYRQAIILAPNLAAAHGGLGDTLLDTDRSAEAEASFRKAISLDSKYAEAWSDLSIALYRQGKPAAAAVAAKESIALEPEAFVYCLLGAALSDQGMLGEAENAFRESFRLKPDKAQTHHSFGKNLARQGKLSEAAGELKEAIRLDPKDATFHCDLGKVLADQGQRTQALDAYRMAIKLQPDLVTAQLGLGGQLYKQGKTEEAISVFKHAVELQPDNGEAHCNLGQALRAQGHFPESLIELKRGHELGSKQPGWNNPSAEWIREAERLVKLDAKLAQIQNGRIEAANAAERIELAMLCQRSHRQLFAASARLFGEAFVEQPNLADDIEAGHRYDAACAAARAGCGVGNDAVKLDLKEYARLRGLALAWLQADLAACRLLVKNGPEKARSDVAAGLRHWQEDADLASVRGDAALAKLPETERQPWQKLWADVAELLKRSEEPLSGKKPTP